MTEAEFITYCTETMWRSDDETLIAAMPNILNQTNKRIERDLNIPSQSTHATIAISDGYGDLPENQRIQAVYSRDRGQLYYYPPGHMLQHSPTGGYTILGGRLFTGTGNDLPLTASVEVVYYPTLEPYFDENGTEGFQSRHPDFYLVAALGQAYRHVRDYQASGAHMQEYSALLEDVRRYELYKYYGDTGIAMPVPGIVA